MKELARHAPERTVEMLASEEGDLTEAQVRALVDQIWSDHDKRASSWRWP